VLERAQAGNIDMSLAADIATNAVSGMRLGVADHMLKLSAQDSSIDFTVNGLISDHQYMPFQHTGVIAVS